MAFEEIATRGLVLLGAGRMGSAMLSGWISAGIPPGAVTVLDPAPADSVKQSGVRIGGPPPGEPAVLVVAVKPQTIRAALPQVAGFGGGGTLIVSVAAGTQIALFEEVFGDGTPIVRAMPNTPAAIGQGITAIVGNAAAGVADLDLAEALVASVGGVVRLDSEGQMDAVTALSGSGPAYVFHLIECMTAAGVAEGLSEDLARELATATVAGAGALALQSAEAPGQLRENVTSPGGTTQAALEILMDGEAGLPPLMRQAVAAAARRSRELADG